LESFYQYAGTGPGRARRAAVTPQRNLVFGYNALTNPSRGLASFVG